MVKLLISLLLLSFITSTKQSDLEKNLRKKLLTNYSKYVRPVENYQDTLDVTIGLAVQNIESFNQIQETIELNVWLRKYWRNDLLNWNDSNYNITQMTLDNNEVWTPDIELINAATLPDIYTLKGGMYLYSDGSMLWSMPSVYKFSCALNLEEFPFDTQDCSMKFGSWTYDNTLLTLMPHGSSATQIDVLDSFSHSEWKLERYYISNYNETRECCGEKLFDINEYHFLLSRYTHYYTLNMGMTIALVVVSFIIMLIKPDNLSRTGTAVFIPLTILALQLTIADKIPVVGYYTLMDKFFLTCFITSMFVSIESGIVYTFITSKSSVIFNLFNRIINYDDCLLRIRKHNIETKERNEDHELFILSRKQTLFPVILNDLEEESKIDELNSKFSNSKINNTSIDEFETTINNLNSLNNSSNIEEKKEIDSVSSDELSMSGFSFGSRKVSPAGGSIAENQQHKTLSKSEPLVSSLGSPTKIIESGIKKRSRNVNNLNKQMLDDNTVVEKNIIKTIEFDNRHLSLTYKEYILFNEVTRIFVIVDNIFRVILPVVFFSIMIYIFSFGN